jgi:hypothetical protein
MVSREPGRCGVGFKEWAGVCDALIDGRQSLILRKGGISESPGPGTFVPEHSEFWLYPTWVHQAQQGVRDECRNAPPVHLAADDGTLPIRALVRVDVVGYLAREETLRALEELHVFTAETVRKRFHYRRPGLWVLGARVWRHDPGFAIAATPEHAGCKTWVIFDRPLPTSPLLPVLEERDWAERLEHLRSILGTGGSSSELVRVNYSIGPLAS